MWNIPYMYITESNLIFRVFCGAGVQIIDVVNNSD